MLTVGCAMDDDDRNNKIDASYALHKKRCELEGMVAMSEFDYINMVIIRNPTVIFPHH